MFPEHGRGGAPKTARGSGQQSAVACEAGAREQICVAEPPTLFLRPRHPRCQATAARATDPRAAVIAGRRRW